MVKLIVGNLNDELLNSCETTFRIECNHNLMNTCNSITKTCGLIWPVETYYWCYFNSGLTLSLKFRGFSE